MQYQIANWTVDNLVMWCRKMLTPYDKLFEHEKVSDRKEVYNYLSVIEKHYKLVPRCRRERE